MTERRSTTVREWESGLNAVRELFLLQVPTGLFKDEPPLRFDAPPRERAAIIKLRLRRLAGHPELPNLQITSLARPRGCTRVCIGTSHQADVVLDGERISSWHAKFTPLGWGGRLTDLESAGGTCVEGSRLAVGLPAPVVPGQVIRLGAHEGILLGAMVLDSFLSSPAVRGSVHHARSLFELPAQGVDLRDLAPSVAGLAPEELDVPAMPSFLLKVSGAAEARLEGLTSSLDSLEPWLASPRAGRAQALVHALPQDALLRSVGRAEARSDLLLDVKAVSKRHARIGWSQKLDRWTVVDLESTNGTFLGKRRLPPGIATPVRPGELISFATYRAVVLGPQQLVGLARTLAG